MPLFSSLGLTLPMVLVFLGVLVFSIAAALVALLADY